MASPSVVPHDIADVLGEVTIFTAAGEPVQFKDLWDQQEGLAVVALLRHFGCFCSWELALALKEAKEKFDKAGVKLIAVGVGTPDKAQVLAQGAYEIMGLHYGLLRWLNTNPGKLYTQLKTVKKATKNYTVMATPNMGSVLQQGGMFVFKGKKLLYARKDERTADHAPLDDVIDVCCKVPTA